MKQPPVTIHLLVNGKEIAASCGPVNPTTNDWYFNQHKELSVPTLPRNHWLTLADITKTNGEVALVVKASGQPIKTYKAVSPEVSFKGSRKTPECQPAFRIYFTAIHRYLCGYELSI